MADQVLGPLEAQDLLVAQRRHAGRRGEPAGEGTLADVAGDRQFGERQRVGEPRLVAISTPLWLPRICALTPARLVVSVLAAEGIGYVIYNNLIEAEQQR